MKTPFGVLLEQIGWERQEVANRLGVSTNTIANWIRGHRAAPETVVKWLETVASNIAAAGRCPEGWSPRSAGRPVGQATSTETDG